MNVLSLFDGMSCGQIALERAGIKVDHYFASELDKYAIKVTTANFPDTVQLGNVLDVEGENLPKIDLLIGGSPCQGFSFAGKRLNFDDPRSALFFEYVRILKEVKPKYFLMENVRMKQEYQDVISEALGVEPIAINSNLVSAQNRYRLYWTNIPNVTQPEDRGIMLKDIIEGKVDAKYNTNNKNNSYKSQSNNSFTPNEKFQTLCAGTHGYSNGHLELSSNGMFNVGDADIKGNDSIKRVYHPEGKGPTLSTCQGGHREPKIVCARSVGRYIVDGKRQDHKQSIAGLSTQRIETRKDGKTGTISTVQKDNLISNDNLHWRKLTPLECERLQTVPDNYTNHVSNTQRYKMLGNGWTVDVISHIFRGMNADESS